jgi:integrase/recombinase XerD
MPGMDAQLIPQTSFDITDIAGQLGARSRRIYRNDASVFARWMYEQAATPETLTRSMMIAYRSYLGETYAKATAQRMFSVARRVLQELAYNGKIPFNPADGIRGFTVANETTHTALTRLQARDLLRVIDTDSVKGKRDYALIMLLVRTGLRRSECAALNISDIKLEQGHHIAIIRHGKGDKRAIVKIPVDVFRAIQTYIEAAGRQNSALDAPLFVGFDKGDRMTETRVSDKLIERMVKHYGQEIGVPELTPHGLRATFITLSLEGGASLHQVQYASRHADPRTTERYQKRKLNLDDNAVDYIRI